MRAEGRVVTAEELLEKAWDENADPFTNAVRVAVMTLRRKLAGTWAPGDQVLLERLITNLVANAIKYNEPGGWVEVEVTGESAGPALIVRNTGPHVPAEMVPILFEPFRRLGADRVRGRGGVGLGLAIVRSIVIAHEGTVRIKPRTGGGLELEVGLPGGPASGYAVSQAATN